MAVLTTIFAYICDNFCTVFECQIIVGTQTYFVSLHVLFCVQHGAEEICIELQTDDDDDDVGETTNKWIILLNGRCCSLGAML